MHISGMNVRITFQQNKTVVDDIGNHVDEWTDYFSCYATCSDKYGDEEEKTGQTVVKERMDFTVRFSSETAAITPQDFRIVFGNRIYNITAVDDMGFKHHSLKMHGEKEREEYVKCD